MRGARQRQHGLPEGGAGAIVLGGSAGALDALLGILGALPEQVTAPLVVVQHLPRHRKSKLVRILQGATGRAVREAQDKEPLADNVVFVAPPDYHLLIDEGPVLALSVDGPVNFSIPSIDVLFESAADVLGSSVIAVLLSGANEDGARGLRAIVDAGGRAMIQAPDEATSTAMPEAAMGFSPHVPVLPVRDLCERLRKLGTHIASGGTTKPSGGAS